MGAVVIAACSFTKIAELIEQEPSGKKAGVED
jgi:hypothetical protein